MSTRYVHCGGVDLPACIHPDGCDEPQAPNVSVCRHHMPAQFESLDEIAARIDEFAVRKRSNGYAVEHWTGCWLPVPVDMEHPWLGGMTARTWMMPRWVADEALAAYARGESPGPYARVDGGAIVRPLDRAAGPQQQALDLEEAA